jgi:hypothetical protein
MPCAFPIQPNVTAECFIHLSACACSLRRLRASAALRSRRRRRSRRVRSTGSQRRSRVRTSAPPCLQTQPHGSRRRVRAASQSSSRTTSTVRSPRHGRRCRCGCAGRAGLVCVFVCAGPLRHAQAPRRRARRVPEEYLQSTRRVPVEYQNSSCRVPGVAQSSSPASRCRRFRRDASSALSRMPRAYAAGHRRVLLLIRVRPSTVPRKRVQYTTRWCWGVL